MAWLNMLNNTSRISANNKTRFAAEAMKHQSANPGFFYDTYVSKLEHAHISVVDIPSLRDDVLKEISSGKVEIVDVVNISKLPWAKDNSNLRVEWTKPQQKQIVRYCRDWISKQKFAAAVASQLPSEILDDTKNTMLAVESIAIQRGDKSKARRSFKKLILELNSKGLDVVQWSVCDLPQGREKASSNSADIKRLINDSSETKNSSGFEAISNWAMRQNYLEIPPIPLDLLEAVCCLIFGECYLKQIKAMDILRMTAEHLSGKQISTVVNFTQQGILALTEATSYNRSDGGRVENSNLTWYPKLRLSLAKFVSTINFLHGSSTEFTSALAALRQDCLSTVRFAAEYHHRCLDEKPKTN